MDGNVSPENDILNTMQTLFVSLCVIFPRIRQEKDLQAFYHHANFVTGPNCDGRLHQTSGSDQDSGFLALVGTLLQEAFFIFLLIINT